MMPLFRKEIDNPIQCLIRTVRMQRRQTEMSTPVKAAVGPDYKAMDDRLAHATHIRFGLPAVIPDKIKRQIKRADRMSAWLEAIQIAGFSKTEADKLFTRPKTEQIERLKLTLRPPMQVKTNFIAKFDELAVAMQR